MGLWTSIALLACQTGPTPSDLGALDAEYLELMADLGVANRDTARSIQNQEARNRKVAAEQRRIAFFQDPAVTQAIETARSSADPSTQWKGEAWYREAILIRSWSEEEKKRETELLAEIDEKRSRSVTWSNEDGTVEVDLVGRWPGVSEDADDLSVDERAEVFDMWLENRVSWLDEDVSALVRLRNEVARREGFDTYWQLALAHRGLEVDEVEAMLTELEALVGPLNQSSVSEALSGAQAAGVPGDLAHLPYLQRKAGLVPVDTDQWFDTDLAEERVTTSFASMGASMAGLQVYIGPSRTTRSGAYSFPIRPPDHAAVVLSNDRRWSAWPYLALAHEAGLAYWWRNLPPGAATSPVVWQPPTPWFEGFGNFFEHLIFEPEWLATYVPDMPKDQAQALAASRVQDTIDSLTWYIGCTRAEQALYEHPGDLDRVGREAAEREAALRGWSFPAPTAGERPYTSSLQSGLSLRYPAYVQNFLFSSVTEAVLMDAARSRFGTVIDNPEVGAWLAQDVVQAVGPDKSFPQLLDELSKGKRTAPLEAWLTQ